MEFLISLKHQSFALALCYILAGVFFILCPGTAAVIIVRIIAVAALVVGIVKIAEFFSSQKYEKPFSNSLASGVVLSSLSVFMLTQPQTIVSIIYVIIGIALMIDGVISVQSAIDLWHFQENRNWLLLVLGAVILIFGGVVLFHPFSSAETLIFTSGIFMLIGGISDLVALAYIYRASKSFDQKMK